ncbi:hypothetical protein BU15DRAFT_79792 [Melanogaster broomeanus]|nr:hypothetical protein BU15DRAFT_79792 [Melanogaster broomeanus]
MSSSDESVGNTVSERETQFVPRSDDDAERGKKYRVKWAGIDPATRKPWSQSWVDKHDCTDQLVAEWKATKKKEKLEVGKKRGASTRTSIKSRASVSSKTSAASSSRKPRDSAASKLTSSRQSSDEPPSAPPKKPSTKRKRQSETAIPTTSVGDEVLIPLPLSYEDERPPPKAKAKTTARHKGSSKGNEVPPDTSDEDEVPRAKSTTKATQKRKAHLEEKEIRSEMSDELDLRPPRAKGKPTPQSNVTTRNGVVPSDASSPYERPPRSNAKIKAAAKRRSSSEEHKTHSEEEVEAVVSPPIKFGPPRGALRQKKPTPSGLSGKPLPSCTKSRKHESADEDAPAEESRGRSRSKSSPSDAPPAREVPSVHDYSPDTRPDNVIPRSSSARQSSLGIPVNATSTGAPGSRLSLASPGTPLCSLLSSSPRRDALVANG